MPGVEFHRLLVSASEVSSPAGLEDGAFEDGAFEDGADEDGADEDGADEDGADEDLLDEVAPAVVASPARSTRLELPGGGVRGALARVSARRGMRFDPGRRAAAAVGIAALAAVLLAGTWVALGRPHAAAVTSVTAAPTSSSSAARSSAETGVVSPAAAEVSAPAVVSSVAAGAIVVDVVGEVARPGIYRLAKGARVDDALKAAGGPVAGVDMSTLNLARVLTDGEQVAVGIPGAPDAGGANSADGSGTASAPIDLNTASLAQLDALPGVGPVLAQHILAWRQQHGKFTSIDQLREVSGIGEAKFADLRPLVTVS